MNPSDVSPKEIRDIKKIGHLGSDQVYQINTKGGLTLILVKKDGEGEFIGAGSHQAMARYAAKKKRPDLVYTEMAKSEVDPGAFSPYLPEFESLVDTLNSKL